MDYKMKAKKRRRIWKRPGNFKMKGKAHVPHNIIAHNIAIKIYYDF
jgi:hypothetical protein